MYCKSCGELMRDDQDICMRCGTKKGTGNAFCANCGQPLTAGADFCVNCGAAVKKTGEYAGFDKVSIALICFVFGGWGVHNFLMGEVKKGIVKIILSFCCGISFILVIIDFIKILTDTYEIDPERFV